MPSHANADEIREFVKREYIVPARLRGDTVIRVNSGEVHNALGYVNRYPAVCGAIGTRRFQTLCNVEQVSREGPTNGADVYFTFRILAN